jgi:tetratricopeptide (TPR) repeat protein
LSAARSLDDKGFWKECPQAYGEVVHELENDTDGSARLIDLAEAQWLLGRAYKRTGRFAEAEKAYDRSIALYESAGYGDKPQICSALNECGQLYLLLAHYGRAQDMLDRAGEIQTAHLKDDDCDVAQTLHNRAKLIYLKGQPLEAMQLIERAIAIRTARLGENDSDTSDSLEVFGFLLKNAGHFDRAEAIMFKNLETQENNHGPDHPLVASALVSLCEVLHHRKKYARILPLLKRAAKIVEERIGEENNAYASAMNILAMYHVRQGELNEAAVFAEKALAVAEKIFGPEHIMLSSLVNNLAVLYRSLRREKECLAASERAKALLKMRLVKTDGGSLQAMTLLADKLSMEQKHTEALEMLDRALTFAREKHGEKSLKVGEILHSRAAVYFNLQDWPAAQDCYIEEIALIEAHNSDSALELGLPLRMLAAVRLKQGDKGGFEAMRNRARAIEQKHGMEDYALVVMKREFESLKCRVGDDHPMVTEKYRELALIQQQHGDDEGSFKNLDIYLHRRAREYKPNGEDLIKDLITSVFPIQINAGRKVEATKMLASAVELIQSEDMHMDLTTTFFLLQGQLMVDDLDPALATARTLPALCQGFKQTKVIDFIKRIVIENAGLLEEGGHTAEAEEMRSIAEKMHA